MSEVETAPAAEQTYETAIWERDGGVGTLILNRPETLNAWNRQFGHDLRAILEGPAADPEVRCVVIKGAGRGFSSGADLKSMGDVEMAEDGLPDIKARLHNLYHPVIRGVRALPKPVIASVHGTAAGIGCSLALACDLVVAAEDSKFLLAFARVGLVPDGGSTVFVPVRVGKARATEMMMLAEPVEAPKALEWGLINRVFPTDQLESETKALAERLATGPTLSYAAAKRAINLAEYRFMEEQLDLEATEQHQLMRSQDAVEGAMAFIQKRPPEFKGA
jgi:2-(1,2-epoxy-1,2-dihydrophenyl)acetyl-CoA isomerase